MTSNRIRRVLLLLLPLLSPCAYAETTASDQPPDQGRISTLNQAVAEVPGEISTIVRYPLDQPADFAKVALGIGLLIALDKPITRAYQDHIQQPLSGFQLPPAPGPFKNAGTEGSADGWLLLGVAGTYVGGLLTDDRRMQQVGLASTKAMVYSVAISQLLLKSIAGRKRPLDSLSQGLSSHSGQTSNPYDFFNHRPLNFSNPEYASSFPSFHFTAWFAVAKVYQQAYDDYLVPYSLLTVGLASNIQGHRHWVSDMVAGALIGTLIGWATAQNISSDDKGPKLDASWHGGGPRLRMSYRF